MQTEGPKGGRCRGRLGLHGLHSRVQGGVTRDSASQPLAWVQPPVRLSLPLSFTVCCSAPGSGLWEEGSREGPGFEAPRSRRTAASPAHFGGSRVTRDSF